MPTKTLVLIEHDFTAEEIIEAVRSDLEVRRVTEVGLSAEVLGDAGKMLTGMGSFLWGDSDLPRDEAHVERAEKAGNDLRTAAHAMGGRDEQDADS